LATDSGYVVDELPEGDAAVAPAAGADCATDPIDPAGELVVCAAPDVPADGAAEADPDELVGSDPGPAATWLHPAARLSAATPSTAERQARRGFIDLVGTCRSSGQASRTDLR
jgi:hypothetical protein